MGLDRTGDTRGTCPTFVGTAQSNVSNDDITTQLNTHGTSLIWRASDDRKALGFLPEQVDNWFNKQIAALSLIHI